MAHESIAAAAAGGRASLILNSVAAALIALLTFGPFLKPVWLRISSSSSSQSTTKRNPGGKRKYEDGDGKASSETEREFSARWPCAVLSVAALSGGCVSAAAAVVLSSDGGERAEVYWLHFVAWALIVIQASRVYLQKQHVERFNLAFHASISFAVLLVPLADEGVRLLNRAVGHHGSPVTLALVATNFGLALGGLFAGLAVPRRPQIFSNGRPVDGQHTGSILRRISFSWADVILALAAKGSAVKVQDLPILDRHARASNLQADFQARQTSGSLFKKIIFAHWGVLALHYTVTFFEAVFQITPQIIMYQLLKVLEARDQGASTTLPAALWAVALGLSMIVTQGWIENWMWWIGYGLVQMRLRVQLSALIYSKSLRRKDVKGANKLQREPSDSKNAGSAGSVKSTSSSEASDKEAEEDPDQKSRQGTINLVGVDARRIGEFGVFGNIAFGSIVKLMIVFAFLGKLIGWQALLAGLAAQVITIPLNWWASDRYTQQGKKLMASRDAKLMVLTEALNGIRQIKFSALEERWSNKIKDVRDRELHATWMVYCYDTVLIFLWVLAPVMLSGVSLAVYALRNGSLSPSVAFTTISTLASIELSLSVIPEIITRFIDARVSLGRIQKYLDAPERQEIITPGPYVAFENATIAWPSDEDVAEDDFKLNDINIRFPTNELTVINGRTGSGKSLILAALLGEVELLSGKIVSPKERELPRRHDHKANKSNWIIPESIGFVSQQPWIENCSFRDNILFGLPFDEERYNKVVFACALEKDLDMFTDRDATEIGANGVNLSGGQKWRITFARALYSRAGILILDDVLSAIDAHVGRHIFEHAVTGELAEGRTRILVTHHVSLCLPKMNFEVQLGNGVVEFAGPVDELRRSGRMEQILEEEQAETAIEDDEAAMLPDLQHTMSRTSRGDRQTSRSRSVKGRKRRESTFSSRSRRLSASSAASEGVLEGDNRQTTTAQPKKFVEEETKESGRVKWRIYSKYLNAAGGAPFWIAISALFALYQGNMIARSWWVAIWTDTYKTKSVEPSGNTTILGDNSYAPTKKGGDADLWFYLSIYIALSSLAAVGGPWRYFFVYWGSYKASRRLFHDLTDAVLRAPLRWLDTVPQGRILNRFTADFATIDVDMAICIGFLLYNVAMGLGIILAATVVSPFVAALGLVLLLISTWYASYYIQGGRETKRLESILKSPIFDLFSASLTGITTVRAFRKEADYEKQMFAKIDIYTSASYYMWLFSRWLTFRLDIIGAIFTVATASVIVSLDKIDASLAGFALGFVLQYSEATSWIMRNYSMVELGMNAVERVVEYSEIQTEDLGGADAPAAWPTEGRLSVDNLVVGYADDLPAVLKGLSFEVKCQERIGVVGRTGAGKSSLTLALFRFLEARQGSVHIDGLDISKIKLRDLRSRLAIIPQDPVLFSGTVRSNLDPFQNHDDRELEDALERVQLRTPADSIPSSSSAITPPPPATTNNATNTHANINIFDSLDSPISEGGSNLSQGQRQLLCLARAIIARPKIMVLDEATSAVDKATDALIQRSIREEFQQSTLIVIAHRLSTIADFDRILVMGEGMALEYESPRELMGREKGKGVFRGMVEDSGEEEVLREVIFGSG